MWNGKSESRIDREILKRKRRMFWPFIIVNSGGIKYVIHWQIHILRVQCIICREWGYLLYRFSLIFLLMPGSVALHIVWFIFFSYFLLRNGLIFASSRTSPFLVGVWTIRFNLWTSQLQVRCDIIRRWLADIHTWNCLSQCLKSVIFVSLNQNFRHRRTHWHHSESCGKVHLTQFKIGSRKRLNGND